MRLLFWRLRPEDEERVEKAERELEQARSRWPEVLEQARRARRHGELNGWTDTVRTIFGGDS